MLDWKCTYTVKYSLVYYITYHVQKLSGLPEISRSTLSSCLKFIKVENCKLCFFSLLTLNTQWESHIGNHVCRDRLCVCVCVDLYGETHSRRRWWEWENRCGNLTNTSRTKKHTVTDCRSFHYQNKLL